MTHYPVGFPWETWSPASVYHALASSDGSSVYLPAPLSSDGSSVYLPAPLSSDGSSVYLPAPLSSDGSSVYLPAPLSSDGSSARLPANHALGSLSLCSACLPFDHALWPSVGWCSALLPPSDVLWSVDKSLPASQALRIRDQKPPPPDSLPRLLLGTRPCFNIPSKLRFSFLPTPCSLPGFVDRGESTLIAIFPHYLYQWSLPYQSPPCPSAVHYVYLPSLFSQADALWSLNFLSSPCMVMCRVYFAEQDCFVPCSPLQPTWCHHKHCQVPLSQQTQQTSAQAIRAPRTIEQAQFRQVDHPSSRVYVLVLSSECPHHLAPSAWWTSMSLGVQMQKCL